MGGVRMSIRYAGTEYNEASGTREAFARFSDDLVAEGLPPIVVVSGDRAPAVQVGFFVSRFRQQATGGGPFGDVRWWDGSAWGYPGGTRWVRWSAEGTVAVPGTGNHEKKRSNDLAWPYNSNTWQHRRAQVIAARHNITCDGITFGEWWHWTSWRALGVIGSPATSSTTSKPFTEEDELMTARDDIIREVGKQIAGLDTRRDTAIVWVGGDCYVVDDGAGTKWNVARGQATIQDAFAFIGWLRARGFTEYLNQAPFVLAGYRDITEEGSVRDEVAKAIRESGLGKA